MMKNKILALLLAVLMLASLVVCADAESPKIRFSISQRTIDLTDVFPEREVEITSGETLHHLLERLSADSANGFSYSNDYGFVSINGNLGGSLMDGDTYLAYVYWVSYYNCITAQTGVTETTLEDGDIVRLAFGDMGGADIRLADLVYEFKANIEEAEALGIDASSAREKLDKILLLGLADYTKNAFLSTREFDDVSELNEELKLAAGITAQPVLLEDILVPSALTVKKGSTLLIPYKFVPRNISDRELTITATEGAELVEITDAIDSWYGEHLGKNLFAKAVGNVKLLFEHNDLENGIEVDVTIVEGMEMSTAEIISKTSEYIKNNMVFTVQNMGSLDWEMLALKRADVSISGDIYRNYSDTLYEYLTRADITKRVPDYARAGLTLCSLGLDPENFRGINVLESLYNKEISNFTDIYEVINALQALRGKTDFSSAAVTKEQLVDSLLSQQFSDGSYGFIMGTDEVPDPDTTAMVIAALAPYKTASGVSDVLRSAFNWLSENQNPSGGYSAWGSESSPTMAQVVIALCENGIDPVTDTDYIKNGNNLLAVLGGYVRTDGGVYLTSGSKNPEASPTYQTLRAYASYNRLLENKCGVYDFSDAGNDPMFKAGLEALVSNLENKNTDSYSTATKNAFTTALSEADSVLTSGTKNSDYDNAYFNLTTAYSSLTVEKEVTSGDEILINDRTVLTINGAPEVNLSLASGQVIFTELSNTTPKISIKSAKADLTIEANSISSTLQSAGILDAADIPNLSALIDAKLSSNQTIKSVGEAFGFGSDAGISLDSYATLVLKGKAGSSVGYVNSEGSFVNLTQNTGNDIYYYIAGSDLVVKTKNLTNIVTYETTSTGAPVGTGTGGGGGGSTPANSITFSVDASNAGKGQFAEMQPVELREGDTPYSVLARIIGINKLETRGVGSGIYVFGINGLYEFDHGAKSGWIYYVNGKKLSNGAGEYPLQKGDRLNWVYSLDGVGEYADSVDSQVGGSGGKAIARNTEFDSVIKGAYDKIAAKSEYSDWETLAFLLNGTPLKDNLSESFGSGDFRKITDLVRMAIAIGAKGENLTDFNGLDVIEQIYNSESMERQGINGPIFALILKNAGNYDIGNYTYNEEKLKEIVLAAQNKDGGFGLTKGDRSDVDITAMALTALSYYDEAKVVENALKYLTEARTLDGEFKLNNEVTSESISQVIIALSSLGIDVKTDKRFISMDNKNLIDLLLAFKTEDNLFSHLKGGEANDIATEQALLALIAYNSFKEGRGCVFNFAAISHFFKDNNEISDWAAEGVRLAYERGILQGNENNEFLPKKGITRAELTAVIVRLNGYELSEEDSIFTDVKNDAWYKQYVMTAFENNILNGVSETEFAPDQVVSREQLAVVLYRLMKNTDISGTTVINDIDKAADWAKNAVMVVFNKGIMQGSDGNFDPQGDVTREMTAVILTR